MFSFRKKIDKCADEELMLLICDANADAFSELYMRYSQKMLRLFYRLLKDEGKAQDMVQDLFMKIIEQPAKFDTQQSFSPWIYKIAKNMCLNSIRDDKNRLRLLDENFRNDVFDKMPDPDNNIFQNEYSKQFAKLDAETQLLLTLRFQQELPIKEIAHIMNVPEGTVKSRLFYLLKKFSVLLHEFNPAN